MALIQNRGTPYFIILFSDSTPPVDSIAAYCLGRIETNHLSLHVFNSALIFLIVYHAPPC